MCMGDGLVARVLRCSLLLLCVEPLLALRRGCEFSITHSNSLYNFSLAAPSRKYPHGVMSEDGFYKIAVNESLLLYQLCDQMIFNHDQPRCLNCQGCGGPLHCGMQCSALVSENIGGYFVCTTIGQASNVNISLIDRSNPEKGVIVKMFSIGPKENCSLSVSVFCDSTKVQVYNSLTMSGSCDYATKLRHPCGCAKVTSRHRKGLGWFGTLLIIVLCPFGGYLFIGTIYRYFFLKIHGAQAIPNLGFWCSLPQRARTLLRSLVRRLQGFSRDGRGSYAPVRDDRDFYRPASY
ncbi:hypothetical protein AXF42_Ash011110 [Apostasia shenzhenica]|uniref:Uncharacterized protein n=1 Tax=Apostasia shenzhenica TaxID=1088818 RepID=A0A2I0AKV8_9ASPA|nr:hypothetical protein AXF42_Ash011110 [Apostasia shenzhenica]